MTAKELQVLVKEITNENIDLASAVSTLSILRRVLSLTDESYLPHGSESVAADVAVFYNIRKTREITNSSANNVKISPERLSTAGIPTSLYDQLNVFMNKVINFDELNADIYNRTFDDSSYNSIVNSAHTFISFRNNGEHEDIKETICGASLTDYPIRVINDENERFLIIANRGVFNIAINVWFLPDTDSESDIPAALDEFGVRTDITTVEDLNPYEDSNINSVYILDLQTDIDNLDPNQQIGIAIHKIEEE